MAHSCQTFGHARSAGAYTLTWRALSAANGRRVDVLPAVGERRARPPRPSRRARPAARSGSTHGRRRTGCAVGELDEVARRPAGRPGRGRRSTARPRRPSSTGRRRRCRAAAGPRARRPRPRTRPAGASRAATAAKQAAWRSARLQVEQRVVGDEHDVERPGRQVVDHVAERSAAPGRPGRGARSRSSIAALASTPCTSSPRAASGTASRPVPTPSSSTRPRRPAGDRAASSATRSAVASTSLTPRVPLVVDVGEARRRTSSAS